MWFSIENSTALIFGNAATANAKSRSSVILLELSGKVFNRPNQNSRAKSPDYAPHSYNLAMAPPTANQGVV
ncbi:hypothetical protein BGAL_0206g00110 [Botrytis galanthina]|uniref:Uncharacterized protein n=1 Tax=Botrytis galanthina TaxID=278940 RepID=A0A4S8QW73_9HELO|nr:hypothetical protein BGAL_0206g00110 [Botrytis galanthina]